MSRIIVDTSFLVGLIDDKDMRRAQILRIQEALEREKWEIVLFDCVLNEVISVLAKRLEEKGRSSELPALIDKVERFAQEQGIQWLYPDLPDKVWDVLDSVRHYKGSLNFHDALVALAARELSLRYIVSFDRDFDEETEEKACFLDYSHSTCYPFVRQRRLLCRQDRLYVFEATGSGGCDSG